MADLPLTWMADVLRAAGCRVEEAPGWKTRGRPRSFGPIGIMLHHDASPAGETAHGWEVIAYGREGLDGPLGNLWLAYDGTWWCIAAGSANHAGEGDGSWGDIDDGNHDAIGIETDHTSDERWTGGQQSSALRGCDALRRKLGMTDAQIERRVLAHKEWAPSRKIDPDPMNMNSARAQLAAYDPTDNGDPVHLIQKGASQPRTLNAEAWNNLRFSDDDDDPTGVWAVAKGEVKGFILTAQAVIEGDAGTVVLLRAVRDGMPPALAESYTIPDGGTLYAHLEGQGSLPAGSWLRVQGKVSTHSGGTATVTSDKAQVSTW
jgi:N-acetylmuramoyl-L-alanine amidase